MPGSDRPPIPPTVVLPKPGAANPRLWREEAAAAATFPGFRAQPPAFDAAEARPGVNPLVDAAADLFDLIVYLQSQTTAVDIATLRAKTLALVRRFEAVAGAAGVAPQVVDAARYAVVATVDDLVMAKPWGLEGGWDRQKLVAAIYGEVVGGERFFDLLAQAEARPDLYGDLIEFMYVCLSLGFVGAFRMRDRGDAADLQSYRAKAFEAIRSRRGGFATLLSPRWKGTEAARRPLREIVPLWLAGAVSLAATAAVFFAFVFVTGGATARAVMATSALEPVPEVEIVMLEEPAPRPSPPPEPQQMRLERFLADEITAGRVQVFVEGGQTRIRLVSEGMFRSGQAVLQEQYKPIIQKVAVALNDEGGRVLVEGHSDAAPISTARFPSNFHLSKARAEAVAAFMRGFLGQPGRLDVTGRGDTVLLDPKQPRGAVNRRVELVLDRPVDQGRTP
jgi:type VI secretion system protein ImpK